MNGTRGIERRRFTPGEVMSGTYRNWIGILMAAILFAGVALCADDPVEDLRQTLAKGSDDNVPEAVDYRRTKTREVLLRIKTIGQMRRALVLDEWKTDPGRVINPQIKAVDIEMRSQLGERMVRAMKAAVDRGDPNSGIAVANQIAELGPTVRALEEKDRNGFSRGLTPLVARLCADRDLGVRQEALRAIGNINGVPSAVAEVLKNTLKSDPEVGPKRIAADGLQQMIKVVSHLQRQGQTTTGVEADTKDLIETLRQVIPVAAAGLDDGDSEVRALCLNAVREAAQILSELMNVPKDFRRNYFPPVDRALSKIEREKIVAAYELVARDFALVKPAQDAIRAESARISVALGDPESRVRLAACQAFEGLANARLSMIRRANNLPSLKNVKEGLEKTPVEITKNVTFLDAFIARDLPRVEVLLRDPDIMIRRSSAEILERLEEKGIPALAGVVLAMQDRDRMVRWTAARAVGTMGKLPPDQNPAAVAGLAKLLSDSDLNLRIAAAYSLEAMGPVAADAIPALGEAIRVGDVEVRQACMYALIKMGSRAVEALPALIEALKSNDSRVLKIACETIAEIGPPAIAALPALRRLIGSEEGEVRSWASEAMLSIQRGNE